MSNLLGGIKGFTSAGEVFNLWQRGLIENKACGCQKPFSECSYWQTVLRKAFGDAGLFDVRSFLKLQQRFRNKDLLLRPLYGSSVEQDDCMPEYANILSQLYSAIAQTSKSRVIVDSSKIPVYAYILNNIKEVELYLVHLVRDPRAVAYSWLKKKRYDPLQSNVAFMDRYNPAKSTLIWLYWNLLIEYSWALRPNYFFLRYEDFIEKPGLTLAQVVSFVHEDTAAVPVFDGNAALISPNHNVSGNPSRFQHGRVLLQLDDRWRKDLAPSYIALVNTLSFPLRKRYGYV